MRRVQAFEFHERAECPALLRDAVVEIVGLGLARLGYGALIGPAFRAFAARAGTERVLDLCSGTGEHVRLLLAELTRRGEPTPKFVLSDLFPRPATWSSLSAAHAGLVASVPAPVDATRVGDDVAHDTRTIINALHHFAPRHGARIVRDAVEARRSLFIYEGFPRELACYLATLPAMLPALLHAPLRARHGRLEKLLLTYLVPVIPLIASWDGFVSVLRVYSRDELYALTCPHDQYQWEYRELPYGRFGRTVIFGGIPEERLR